MNWRRVFGLPQAPAPVTAAGEPDAGTGTLARRDAPGSRADRGSSLGVIPLHEEPATERWGRRGLRTLLVVALVLLVFVGLRTLVRPYPKPDPYVPAAALTYDRTAAQAIAARWADAYLTLGHGDAGGAARMAALALDSAPGIDTSGGVNVTDPQTVQEVLPGMVQVAADGGSAVVTVLARVRTGDQPPRWLALAVPVGSDGKRPVVTASGAFVAIPPPGQSGAADVGLGQEDSDVTSQTQSRAQAWFTAYGGTDGGALTAISAPGSTAAPLGGLTLKSIDSWHVYAGDANSRAATAGVTWSTPSGTVQQHYMLTLSAVRSGATNDWRVLSATASTTR